MGNLQREQDIIGGIISDSSSLKNIYLTLKPEMFDNDICRKLYQESLFMFSEGKDIDYVSISQRAVSKEHPIEEIVEFIKICLSENISSSYVPSLANQLIEDYKRSQIRKVADQVDFDNPNFNDEIIKVIGKLESLAKDRKENVHYMPEVVDGILDNYFVDKEIKRINTGFNRIDNTFGGLEGGEFIVIGARPGVGKSALVTQMVTNMAFNGIKVGYFNLEMSESQIFERMVSRLSQISLSRLRHAKYPLNDRKGNELDRFRESANKLRTNNICIISGSIKVSEIKEKCRFRDFDIVIIDYLQLIKADREFQNRANEVGLISKSLKELAMELHIPIIALSQMNRNHIDSSEPDISELRESGDIEQDASIIALMWNHKNDIKGFKVAKNRQGECAKFGLRFNGQYMEFEECDLGDNSKAEMELPYDSC